MMPALQAGQSLIFFGEGSGSLVAFDALGKHEKSGIRVGEAKYFALSSTAHRSRHH